ncbi:hypothetical protein BC628DRAFT_593303 [Trametes gibbosa]|nr:hypothetical protein BC628DRAFT_593303 [Trametes gibbosa]
METFAWADKLCPGVRPWARWTGTAPCIDPAHPVLCMCIRWHSFCNCPSATARVRSAANGAQSLRPISSATARRPDVGSSRSPQPGGQRMIPPRRRQPCGRPQEAFVPSPYPTSASGPSPASRSLTLLFQLS